MSKAMWVSKMACVMSLAVLVVLAGGCKGGKGQQITPDLTGEEETGMEETTTGLALPEIGEGTLFDSFTGLQKVYFDYDSFALRPDALRTLSENADKIKQVPNALIQIEGHCDERGTQEYNLALGERRALAIREHLIKLGVSGDRMVTISYGEERPEVEGHSEAAWSKNRRSEFNKANM